MDDLGDVRGVVVAVAGGAVAVDSGGGASSACLPPRLCSRSHRSCCSCHCRYQVAYRDLGSPASSHAAYFRIAALEPTRFWWFVGTQWRGLGAHSLGRRRVVVARIGRWGGLISSSLACWWFRRLAISGFPQCSMLCPCDASSSLLSVPNYFENPPPARCRVRLLWLVSHRCNAPWAVLCGTDVWVRDIGLVNFPIPNRRIIASDLGLRNEPIIRRPSDLRP